MNAQLVPFMAGLELAGQRLANGKLRPHQPGTDLLDDWPETFRLFDRTYTLEDIRRGVGGYESALYV